MTIKQKINNNKKEIEKLEKLCKDKEIKFTYTSYWHCMIDYERQAKIELDNKSLLKKHIRIVEEL